ncbi:NAD(P)H-hydrate epimerase [Microbacterium protaetiae]|uniref:NAD(P)H-hydrate epimerase n=1 Tax=Microbacterium protaetiae TaxID=2509458 RepID=A0A4P6EM69_9MICO|nr:NAD(P)H-hydrate epimerase [Microbacterium protaetiae]QAY61337.1 NAD(P)H-hydrate epimerase [Microbacterium protaetiae]
MRSGYTAQQIRSAEAPLLAAGVPLMARAATGLADVVREVLQGRDAAPGRVLLLVGSGNNGGDALFAGAALAADGCQVSIIDVGSRIHEEGLAAARQAGAVIVPDAAAAAASADVIVDGILGTGAADSPALRGRGREVVTAVLPALTGDRAPAVVAVDIPSGVNPDDGTVPDATVLPADLTVTFGAHKAGLLRGPAVAYAGEVRLVDIGLGEQLANTTPVLQVP